MRPAYVLVVGATGTSGRELLRQLGAAGLRVRALVRDIRAAASLASPFVDLVEGDLSDPASIKAALSGVKKAYFASAVHADAAGRFDTFLAAAIAEGVEHIVRLSALSASPQSPVKVLELHGSADEALVNSGLAFTLLRPNVFYQNLLWQASSIVNSGIFYLPYGDARQSMVDVADVASVALCALTDNTHENKTYNLTGPDSINYFEVAKSITAATDQAVSYVPVSNEAAKMDMLKAGMPVWQAEAISEFQAYFGLGHHELVTDDVERVLGRPPGSIDQFASRSASVFYQR